MATEHEIPTPQDLVEKSTEEQLRKEPDETAGVSALPEEPTAEEAGLTQPTRTLKSGEYIEAVGRRKRAVARVRIFSSKSAKDFTINGTPGAKYFKERYLQRAIEPLERVGLAGKLSLSVRVQGGGTTGQAEAVRMGLSRALDKLDSSFHGKLKRAGYLTRDSREKERRKYGLKKARRAPQFSKR